MRLVEDVDLLAARRPARRRPTRAARGCRRPSSTTPRPSRSRRASSPRRSRRTTRRPRTASTVGPSHAVQAGREDLRHRGLAGAARADEEVGVVDAVALDRVGQRAHDVLLPDHLGEGPRAVAAVERGACGHGQLSLPRASRRPDRARRDRRPARADSVPGDAVQGAARDRRRRDRCCGWRSASASPTTTRSTRWSGASSSPAGRRPATASPLAPTPHPLLELLGVIARAARRRGDARDRRRARLPRARRARLPRLPCSARAGSPGRSGSPPRRSMLSRYEVLSYGVRAYADIPYVVLVLAALAIETRRRARRLAGARAARRSPACCGPEAWLFAGVYWLLPVAGARPPRERARLAGARRAGAGAVGDSRTCSITGNALWSLTNTQATGERRCNARRASSTSRTTGRAGSARCSAPTAWSPARSAASSRCGSTRARALLGAAAGVLAVVALAHRRRRGAADPGPLRLPDRGAPGASSPAPACSAGARSPPGHPRRRLWQGGVGRCRRRDRRLDPAWQVPRFHKTFDSTRARPTSRSAPSSGSRTTCRADAPHAISAALRADQRALRHAGAAARARACTRARRTSSSRRSPAARYRRSPASAAVHREYHARPQRPPGAPAPSRPASACVASNRSWRVYSSC